MARLLKFKKGRVYGKCNCCATEDAPLHGNSHVIPMSIIRRLLKDHPDLRGVGLDTFHDEKPKKLKDKSDEELEKMFVMRFKWCDECEKKSGNEDDNFYASLLDKIKKGKRLKLKAAEAADLHKFVVSIVIRTMLAYDWATPTICKLYLEWSEDKIDAFPIMVERNAGMLLPLQLTKLGINARKGNRNDAGVICLGRLSFVIYFNATIKTVDNMNKEELREFDKLLRIEFVRVQYGISRIRSRKLWHYITWGYKHKIGIMVSRTLLEGEFTDISWVDRRDLNFILLQAKRGFSIEETRTDDSRSVLGFIKQEVEKRGNK